MEYKLLDNADLKFFDEGAGVLAGYASVFNNVDNQGERVKPGAFVKYLPDFLRDGFVALGHDWSSLPIGTPVEAREDDHGLYVKAAFHSTPTAQEARKVIMERLERGNSVPLSIGYEVLDATPSKGVRDLNELRLYEWSVVTVPANRLASVTFAKALPPEGAPLPIYKDAAEAAQNALIREYRTLEERRLKAGRMISEANMRVLDDAISAMGSALDTLKGLRSAAEPIEKLAIDRSEDVKNILANLEKWEKRLCLPQ